MRGLAAVVLGPLLRELGEREAAWSYVSAMLPIGSGTSVGDLQHDRGLVMQRLAVALALDDGNPQAAREWLEAHDRWLAWNGAVLGQSEGHALWAQYYRQAGDTTGIAHAERASPTPRNRVSRSPWSRRTASVGELDTDAGQYEDAEAHLTESLTLAEACAAPYERALTLLAIAGMRAAPASGGSADSCSMRRVPSAAARRQTRPRPCRRPRGAAVRTSQHGRRRIPAASPRGKSRSCASSRRG